MKHLHESENIFGSYIRCHCVFILANEQKINPKTHKQLINQPKQNKQKNPPTSQSTKSKKIIAKSNSKTLIHLQKRCELKDITLILSFKELPVHELNYVEIYVCMAI